MDQRVVNKSLFPTYRGRIAPTPTGLLHRGHAATFARAFRRCREAGGTLILRVEDLDPRRCRAEFTDAALEDLRWLGLHWDEGPGCGGGCGPYLQSERTQHYLGAWARLKEQGWIYPCLKSRREIRARSGQNGAWSRLAAPHEDEDAAEVLFPPEWRTPRAEALRRHVPDGVNWRFRVPDGETLCFRDGAYGDQSFTAGDDFGDFLVWSREGIPAYELAVVVDDHAMAITEVVRGADLLKSTARQILLYRALNWTIPGFYHCPLVVDSAGRRLAKRSDAVALRTLRQQGYQPKDLLDWI